MHEALFYIFSAAALIFGFLVILNPFSRNAVTSAMFLVLTIGSIAGLFVLLEAYFLAAVQVLVYAGAVMVLFLFVIMLLDLKAEERRGFKGWTRKASVVIGVLSVGVLLHFIFRSFHQSTLHRSNGTIEGATAPLGQLLFTRYLLPFELVSVLLLVAMIGVILLSKREVP
jgi:NADH-quinone oxidoreductase subunit J